VTGLDPSLLTLAAVEEMVSLAAGIVPVGVVGVVVGVTPLPPQLASTKVIASTVKAAKDLM
jgi:hypothetical protein